LKETACFIEETHENKLGNYPKNNFGAKTPITPLDLKKTSKKLERIIQITENPNKIVKKQNCQKIIASADALGTVKKNWNSCFGKS
jgi:hypothetical protein